MTVHGSSRADLVTYEARFFLKMNLRDNMIKQTAAAHRVKDVTGYSVSGRFLTFYLKKIKSNLSRKLDTFGNISAEMKGAVHPTGHSPAATLTAVLPL